MMAPKNTQLSLVVPVAVYFAWVHRPGQESLSDLAWTAGKNIAINSASTGNGLAGQGCFQF